MVAEPRRLLSASICNSKILVATANDQHIIRFDRMRRFDSGAIEQYFASLDRLPGQNPGLEESRCLQPLIKPNGISALFCVCLFF